jgi:hypothetical protein
MITVMGNTAGRGQTHKQTTEKKKKQRAHKPTSKSEQSCESRTGMKEKVESWEETRRPAL